MTAPVAAVPDVKDAAPPEPGGVAPPEEGSRKTGFLEDDQGKRSSMRLMSLLSLFAAIVFGGVTIMAAIGVIGQSTATGDAIVVTFGFLLGAFAPKALQKFMETNTPERTGTNK